MALVDDGLTIAAKPVSRPKVSRDLQPPTTSPGSGDEVRGAKLKPVSGRTSDSAHICAGDRLPHICAGTAQTETVTGPHLRRDPV